MALRISNHGVSASGKSETHSGYVVLAVTGVIIFIVIFIVIKIFKGIHGVGETLGISDSKEGKENKAYIDAQVNKCQSDGMKCAWNPNFWKTQFPAGTSINMPNKAKTDDIVKMLWDSVGYVYDTPSRGSGAIHQCSSKAYVSYISDAFYKTHRLDLLTWLNDKYDILGQREYLREMIQYVNSLPKK